MGELVDLSKFGDIEESSKKEITDAVVSNAVDLLRTGKKRATVASLLKGQGYSFADAEKIVSRAEAKLYTKPKQKINFPQLFLMLVAVLAAIGAIIFLAYSFTSDPTDCGDDTFCVQKIIACDDGRHQSAYRGMAYSYEIKSQGGYCQVFVTALESSNPEVAKGMTMNCLYTMENGVSNFASGECDGSLAGPLGL